MNNPIVKIIVNDKVYTRKNHFYVSNNTYFEINLISNYTDNVNCSVVYDDNIEPVYIMSLKPSNQYTISSVFKSDNEDGINQKINLIITSTNKKIIYYKDFYFFNKKLQPYIKQINNVNKCKKCGNVVKLGWNYCVVCGNKI